MSHGPEFLTVDSTLGFKLQLAENFY